jgi:hypothetical protein
MFETSRVLRTGGTPFIFGKARANNISAPHRRFTPKRPTARRSF